MSSALPVEPPDYLDDDALAVWDGLAPDLERQGVLTSWDADAFAVFCTAVVHHRRAVEYVNGMSPLLRGRRDEVVKHPAMQVIRDQAVIVRSFGQEFGLTPSARASVLRAPLRDASRPTSRLLTPTESEQP